MKWIGQSIIDFIARFRGDVYLDSPTAGGSDPDKFLGIDSNGKIIYRTGTQVASDIGAASGDITGVTITADDENSVSDTSGSADFTIAGTNGVTTIIDTNLTISGVNASTSAKGVVELATTAETTTGTDTGRAVTPDGLKDGYQGSANITTLGTIGTGVWNGTAVTKIGTLGALAITQGSTGAVDGALTITNEDVDKKALHIDADNTTTSVVNIKAQDLTTANAIYVNCDSLTTGKALKLDVDDALTTSATKILLDIDYDKAGVTASSQSSITTGLNISMIDAATNNASGTVTNTGVDVTIDAASNQGTINQTGYSATLTDGDVANTVGYFSHVEDGGVDFKAVSSATQADYFKISTTANGATTMETVDDDAALAHFEIAADGDITLDAAGTIKLEGPVRPTGQIQLTHS